MKYFKFLIFSLLFVIMTSSGSFVLAAEQCPYQTKARCVVKILQSRGGECYRYSDYLANKGKCQGIKEAVDRACNELNCTK